MSPIQSKAEPNQSRMLSMVDCAVSPSEPKASETVATISSQCVATVTASSAEGGAERDRPGEHAAYEREDGAHPGENHAPAAGQGDEDAGELRDQAHDASEAGRERAEPLHHEADGDQDRAEHRQ